MASLSRNPFLPTEEECFSLTNEECIRILDIVDPDGFRAQRNWELGHQPQLIRLYMTMQSFLQIERFMRSELFGFLSLSI